MTFEEKLKSLPPQEVWEEYCGFLDLSMDKYMDIQSRLLLEQIDLMSNCELGKRFFGAKPPKSIDEFRDMVPLTKYENYADILLTKCENMLPAAPVIWLSTTWEGGDHPFKCAPYTDAMLEVYRRNILGAMLLSTSNKRGAFHVRPHARVLYSLAPLPYASGLFPNLVAPEISIEFLPPIKDSQKLSFTQRCKKGFQMGISGGMDQFYGMTSIVYSMSKSFGDTSRGGTLRDAMAMSPKMLVRYLKARYRSKRDGVSITPGDIFRLDGFVCVGTDTSLYKNELESLWGRRPLEVAGGTETCLLGTETWSKDGLVFYPDNCFYEFIPESEMEKNLADESYIPRTYLMDELSAGEKYELVITVLKGGAFMRYRVGDIYRCIRLNNAHDGINLPQFEYIDRIPTVIDIDGFTRITEREIETVIELSGVRVRDWIALKEHDGKKHSYLQMYAELDPEAAVRGVADAMVLKEHLSVYFRCFDSDYNDLKRLIGVDPLNITLLKSGAIAAFEAKGQKIKRLNPRKQDVVDLLRFSGFERGRDGN